MGIEDEDEGRRTKDDDENEERISNGLVRYTSKEGHGQGCIWPEGALECASLIRNA